MTLLNFGQPPGGVIQFAYTTPDIERAMQDYSDRLNLGPWFVRGPFQPPQALYRGQPTAISLTLALAFAGHVMIELIEQHNDVPSVYQEIERRRGHGFHHWGVAADRFDEQSAIYTGRGYEIAFFDVSPLGTSVAYFDSTRDLPGMIELIEMNAAQERRYTRMYAETLAWDGSDPIRRMA